MLTNEDLQAIGSLMDAKLGIALDDKLPTMLNKALKPINEKLDRLEESVNIIIEWVDEAARDKNLPTFAAGRQE